MYKVKSIINRDLFKLSAFFPLIVFILCSQAQAKSHSSFPVYSAIKDNISFWEDIYSTHSLSTAIIHDQDDLTKIYEIVPIQDYRTIGSAKQNRRILKKVKKKYKNILNKLAKGKRADTPLERKVASMFVNESPERIRQAAANIRFQVGQKERFIEGVVRSGAYIKNLKTIFKNNNMPEELAYLPHVESSFNIEAYSKRGAAGIWQFTRSTGKDFLRIDYMIDERLDPIESSHAAATFLKQNYKSLFNWPLAITAYNYGPAGTLRAVEHLGDYENIFKKYNKGHFKFASRNFYSEFVAALNSAKKLEKNEHITLDQPLKSKTIKLKGFVSANDICNYFQIDIPTLKQYNPSLLHPILKGEKYIPKDFTLRLPSEKTSDRIFASLPDSYYKPTQKRSLFYVVRKGDTASKIARIHKISLTSLLNANNLKNGDIIYAGKRLRIPPIPEESTSPGSVPVLLADSFKRKHINNKQPYRYEKARQPQKPTLKMNKKKIPQ